MSTEINAGRMEWRIDELKVGTSFSSLQGEVKKRMKMIKTDIEKAREQNIKYYGKITIITSIAGLILKKVVDI